MFVFKKKIFINAFTNQPDVSRGKNSKINVENINFLKRKLCLDDILVNYSDNENDYFRKPGPGTLYYAEKKFNINLKLSYVVGDRWRDIDAGSAAKVKQYLLIEIIMKN